MKLFSVVAAALLLAAPVFAVQSQPQLLNAMYSKPKRAKTHRRHKHKSVRRVSKAAESRLS